MSPAGDFDGDGVRDILAVSLRDDGPRDYNQAGFWRDNFHTPVACPELDRFDAGAVYVFAKGETGRVQERPKFIMHGLERSRLIDSVLGGVDMNGDGLDDFIYGSVRMQTGPVVPLLSTAGALGLSTVGLRRGQL